jgi:predicted RNA methylase
MLIVEHYQPQFWKVESPTGESIEKNWENEDLRRKAEERTAKHYDTIYKSEIRRNLAFYSKAPLPTVYRPILAKGIVDFCKAKKVLDCSIGWGGRMLGTLALDDTTFEGCEPCSATHQGLVDMATMLGLSDRVKLHRAGAEDVLPTLPSGAYDLMLTSPPYFDLEVYSHEDTQSIKKFPTWEQWCDGFLEPVLREVLRCLKDDGVSAWSVKNIKRYKLQDKVFQLHEKYGWKLAHTFGMTATPRNTGKVAKITEETFLFRKG